MAKKQTHFIFVYGTLMREDQPRATVHGFRKELMPNKAYYYAVEDAEGVITGKLRTVEGVEMLKSLDRYEGCRKPDEPTYEQNLYNRTATKITVEKSDGTTEVVDGFIYSAGPYMLRVVGQMKKDIEEQERYHRYGQAIKNSPKTIKEIEEHIESLVADMSSYIEHGKEAMKRQGFSGYDHENVSDYRDHMLVLLTMIKDSGLSYHNPEMNMPVPDYFKPDEG